MVYVIMETAFAILDTTALVATFTVGVCLEMAPRIAMITVFARTGNVSVIPNGKEMLAKIAKRKLNLLDELETSLLKNSLKEEL